VKRAGSSVSWTSSLRPPNHLANHMIVTLPEPQPNQGDLFVL
jgi:hypothetical protein